MKHILQIQRKEHVMMEKQYKSHRTTTSSTYSITIIIEQHKVNIFFYNFIKSVQPRTKARPFLEPIRFFLLHDALTTIVYLIRLRFIHYNHLIVRDHHHRRTLDPAVTPPSWNQIFRANSRKKMAYHCLAGRPATLGTAARPASRRNQRHRRGQQRQPRRRGVPSA
jgi:hypothetical protein